MSFTRQTFDIGTVATTGDILSEAARRAPEKTALIVAGKPYSFSRIEADANRFAQALLAQDLPPGAHIAIMCRNGHEYVAAHFGAARTPYVLVHLSTRYTPDELVHTMNLTAARAIIIDAETKAALDRARPLLDTAPFVISVDPGLGGAVAEFEALIADQPAAAPDFAPAPEDVFSILFTGGTTGKPKGALTTHVSRVTSGAAAIEDHPIHGDDIAAVTTPLCHAAGLFTWFQPVLWAGATAVLMPHWDAGDFIAATAAHGINSAFVVPAQVALLLDHPDFDAEKLSTLRAIICGGAAAHPRLVERFETALPDCDFVVAFGSTETGHVISQQPAERRAKPGSLGKTGPRIELGVFAKPDVPAKPGEIGEIATRGSHLFAGYLDAPDETRAYFRSGEEWGWMGDLGFKDVDGTLTLIGRSKDMILSGGMNIYPAEIEDAVSEYPGLAECAAFGVANEKWGELPALAVVATPGAKLDTDAMLEFAANKLARHKRPRRIELLDELPRTGAGKLQRNVLKERFGGET
jgi:acyl-CoA synthetase (AMP-forming)/AMP-acid ligase II